MWDWLAIHLKKRRQNRNSSDRFHWPGSFSLSFTHRSRKGTAGHLYPLTRSEGGKPQRSLEPLLKLCTRCRRHLPKPLRGLCLNFLFLPGGLKGKTQPQHVRMLKKGRSGLHRRRGKDLVGHSKCLLHGNKRFSLRNAKQIAGKVAERRHAEGVRLTGGDDVPCALHTCYVTSLVLSTEDAKTNKWVLASRSSQSHSYVDNQLIFFPKVNTELKGQDWQE